MACIVFEAYQTSMSAQMDTMSSRKADCLLHNWLLGLLMNLAALCDSGAENGILNCDFNIKFCNNFTVRSFSDKYCIAANF